MKKSLLITAIVLALSGGAFAQTVLPLLPTAHGMTGNQPAYSAQQQQEFPMMATGWNWWSSYIDLSDDGLEMLETSLGSSASTIKSLRDGFVSYSAQTNTWGGNLTSISNEKMYPIQMNSTPTEYTTMTGRSVTTNTIDIPVQAGWNWVGYPSAVAMSVDVALAGYEPTANEIIKSLKSGFATYDASTHSWRGTLANLVPGQGYKIQSLTETAQTFNYPNNARGLQTENPDLTTVCQVNADAFVDNMNFIAVVNIMGEELLSENYEISAYIDNECRGAIKPMYFDDYNRYFVFLTVAGDASKPIEFRLMNYETGETFVANNRYSYNIDAVEGSLNEPYVLNFNTLLNNDEFMVGKMDMFPNPVKRNGMVTLSIPALSKNMRVQVINSLGMVVRTEIMNSEKTNLSANLAPGIYTVKVVAGDKQLFVEKLIVE